MQRPVLVVCPVVVVCLLVFVIMRFDLLIALRRRDASCLFSRECGSRVTSASSTGYRDWKGAILKKESNIESSVLLAFHCAQLSMPYFKHKSEDKTFDADE